MAGASAERQESGFISKVTEAVKKNKGNPVTLVAGKVEIVGVVGVKKYTGRQSGGSEPYTDVVITLNNKKTLNVSMKGSSAPSLAGGGLTGLELAVPGIAKKFMNAAFNYCTKTLKLKPGDKVPDIYGQISDADKIAIVVGNKAMGGPIDFMYIGPMDVNAPYDSKNNQVNANGKMEEAKKYAKSHKLFFRLRARREDQRFDPLNKDKDGTPKIYGKSPSKGDSAGRIVVVDKIPSTANMITF